MLTSFQDWVIQRESSAATRARSAAARGLMPVSTVGSLNGHSTAPPWEAEQIKKAMGKKKKKSKKKSSFRAVGNRKKVSPSNHNREIDKWMTEVGGLKDDLKKLKDVFDKKKSDLKKKPEKPEKPEPKKSDAKPEAKPEAKPDTKAVKVVGKKPQEEADDDVKKSPKKFGKFVGRKEEEASAKKKQAVEKEEPKGRRRL
jgi:hypothetical protein